MDSNNTMKKIEIEWLCGKGHLHSDYPSVLASLSFDDIKKFADEFLKDKKCSCGGIPFSHQVFEGEDIE